MGTLEDLQRSTVKMGESVQDNFVMQICMALHICGLYRRVVGRKPLVWKTIFQDVIRHVVSTAEKGKIVLYSGETKLNVLAYMHYIPNTP